VVCLLRRKPRKERPCAGKHPKGEPKPKDQENFTDPDSRISTTPAWRIAELTPWGWTQARAAETAARSG
jgi:hypothetical protein